MPQLEEMPGSSFAEGVIAHTRFDACYVVDAQVHRVQAKTPVLFPPPGHLASAGDGDQPHSAVHPVRVALRAPARHAEESGTCQPPALCAAGHDGCVLPHSHGQAGVHTGAAEVAERGGVQVGRGRDGGDVRMYMSVCICRRDCISIANTATGEQSSKS